MKSLTKALLAGAIALAPALVPTADAAFIPKIPIMEVEDLRPGMKGYGLSVFEGTEPRRFTLTIKGVLKDRFADGDMIIIECDPDPAMEGIGGIAGMSGSPIFVDDKLVGAFAYGWGFSVRPVNGVTPIRRMLDVMDLVTKESKVSPDEVPESLSSWEPARRELMRRFPPLPRHQFAEEQLEGLGIDGGADNSGLVTFEPLGSPLLASTNSPRVMAQLNRMFEGTSLKPMMAGMQGGAMGDARNRTDATNLKPVNGGALSVVVCEGDLTLAGLGTTTYVEGDRLIAFGHPMMGSGAVDMPIAVSEVITVIPTVARPFKMGNALRTVGALRQDRLPAVGGSLSAAPPRLLPLSVHVKATELSLDKTFNYRLLDDRMMTAGLALTCMMESLEAVRLGGPLGMDFNYTITMRDGRKLKATEFVSGDAFEAMRAGFQLASTLDMLGNNPFKASPVDAVDVEMVIGDRMKMMVFDKVTQKVQRKLEPGDTVRMDVQYVRWRQEPVMVPVELRLPENLRPGSYTLALMDGRERLRLEMASRPELNRIDDYDQLLQALEPSFSGNNAYLVLVDDTQDQTIDGQRLPGLPASVAAATQATLRRPQAAGTAKARIILEKRLPMDAMLVGGTSVPLIVTARPR